MNDVKLQRNLKDVINVYITFDSQFSILFIFMDSYIINSDVKLSIMKDNAIKLSRWIFLQNGCRPDRNLGPRRIRSL